jgi:DNA modification methylase
MFQRIEATAEMINQSGEQWIVWCGLNDESIGLTKAIDESEDIRGSDSPENKASAIEAFQEGQTKVIVTKPRIAGFGMNFQNCHNMAFVGLNDSWEAYYQCIRRCHRFGQEKPVNVHIVLSDAEQPIFDNVMRKEREANKMRAALVEHVREFERAEIGGTVKHQAYDTDDSSGENWQMRLGDSCERMAEIEDESVGLSVFSPPFLSLYTYSPTERDIGNSATPEEFWGHFQFVIRELLRATKPGRNCCVHVSQVPSTLNSDGYIGLKDFRGDCIGAFRKYGWIYHGEVCIDKDPQVQAIRTHAKGLLFAQLRKDGSWLRPGLADFILVFRKPGDNATPVKPDITNEEWITWARPVWYGIKETDVLNTAVAKDNDDERHICPLQLGTIERCIRLWSNPGELICSPFAGIGSEGYMALCRGRRFTGIELKKSYFDTAVKNLMSAEKAGDQPRLDFTCPSGVE